MALTDRVRETLVGLGLFEARPIPFVADAGPDPEEAAIQAGHQRRLDAMIARLPEDFREVLILREMEDMSYREIADITGTPIGTVMSRLARARTMLREFVKEGS